MDLQLSLVDLQSGLRDLYAVREEAETPEEIALLDAEIQRYIATEIRKVDGIADFCVMLDRLSHEPRERKGVKELCEIDQEIKRLEARRERFRKILTSIKEMLKFAMQGMTWKEGKPRKLEGVRHTISLRGNGGAQPVIVTDETLIPDELCNVTVTMAADQWNSLVAAVPDEVFTYQVKREPSLSRMAKTLNEPCGNCDGRGRYTVVSDDGINEIEQSLACNQCGGTGKASVAGARLGERGESVIIS